MVLSTKLTITGIRCISVTAELQETQLLIKYFGKKSFKPWQRAIISAALEGKNTLVVQSTGAGKSLCYQFPCVFTKKMTIALMPTVSLIRDQFQFLQSRAIRVTFLGSLQMDTAVLSKIAQCEYDIVLSTPESFYDEVGEPKPVFKTLYVQKKIGLIAIDEAHLVHSWSSFRYVVFNIYSIALNLLFHYLVQHMDLSRS